MEKGLKRSNLLHHEYEDEDDEELASICARPDYLTSLVELDRSCNWGNVFGLQFGR